MWPGTSAPAILSITPAVFCASVFLPAEMSDKRIGRESEGFPERILFAREELRHAADKSAVLVHAQPVGLAARLDFHVRAELVDLLAGERAAGDRHRLDDLTNERLKAGILQPYRKCPSR